MDYNVATTEAWLNGQMDAHEKACYEIAELNGLTVEQAEMCEEMPNGYGKYRCCGCPWQPTEMAV